MTVLVKFERRIGIIWSSRSIDRSRHPPALRRIGEHVCAATAADAIRLKPLEDTNKIYCQTISSGLSTRRKTRREFLAGGALGSAFALKWLSGPVQQSRAAGFWRANELETICGPPNSAAIERPVRPHNTPGDGPRTLTLGAGFLALRVQVDVAAECGKRVRE